LTAFFIYVSHQEQATLILYFIWYFYKF